jgi:hypothetical protein
MLQKFFHLGMLMDKMEYKDKIMHSFGYNLSKASNQKTSLKKVATFAILLDKME